MSVTGCRPEQASNDRSFLFHHSTSAVPAESRAPRQLAVHAGTAGVETEEKMDRSLLAWSGLQPVTDISKLNIDRPLGRRSSKRFGSKSVRSAKHAPVQSKPSRRENRTTLTHRVNQAVGIAKWFCLGPARGKLPDCTGPLF